MTKLQYVTSLDENGLLYREHLYLETVVTKDYIIAADFLVLE